MSTYTSSNGQIRKVLGRLEKVSSTSTGWEARCPAHDDRTPSLSVDEGKDGRVLLNCHAGCDSSAIVDAMGLEWTDLFPDDRDDSWKPWDGTEVDAYTYHDQQGRPLFQVVRYEMHDHSHPAYGQKQFTQRAYLPDHPKAGRKGCPEGYVWGRSKHGVDALLYRLPKVRRAARDGERVYVVEGEKDVQTLEERGLVATCNPGGASKGEPGKKWTRAMTDALLGAEVVCLPDNDSSGRSLMEHVAQAVAAKDETAKVVHLDDVPRKGDVTDWMERGHDADELETLADEAEPVAAESIDEEEPDAPPVFWYAEKKKDRIGIDRADLIGFLRSEGYGKLYAESDLDSTFVRVQDHVVERVSPERIKDHVLSHVRNLSNGDVPDEYGWRDVEGALLRGSRIYFSESLLQALPPLNVEFQRDTRTRSFFYYQNGFVEVTADGFELKPYTDLDGVIWKEQILDRPFRDLQGEQSVVESDWHEFVSNVMNSNHDRRGALTSAIGYLLHGYKDPANTKAVVFMDEKDSDVPNGRTGKSVVAKGVSHMVPTERIDARNFSFDSRFAFQSVQLGTRVVDFNDASKSFDFERLFSCVTDDWQVERKGQDQISIPFARAPKIVISTNYVLEGEGASFEDRVFQVEFHPHYTSDHKPIDEFGKRFFDQWDDEEWACFDNLMVAWVRHYLRNGLHSYEHVNLNARKLKQETTADFKEWVLDFDFEPRKEYDKAGLYRSFCDAYEPDYENLRKRTFTMWLYTYARLFRGGGEGDGYDTRKSGSTRYIWFYEPDE